MDSTPTRQLSLYNSLSREKQRFEPIAPPFVGMYVCGPTVYSDVHLGNCRTFTSFDVIARYLRYAGYRVRYVRNITDVGHLLDDGEDRMSRGARASQLEPMEVAQKYTIGFHDMMRVFNNLPPSIEPRATGHIPEQIEMIEAILARGYAYEANGSVYFDTLKYVQEGGAYGQLSGRVLEDLLSETRDNLKNQGEKRHPSDFALWMKASEEHIMRWNSPWSIGFPGWHLECSAMSTKYLGQRFDIHGGGNDLKFPHHENEVAQSVGACGVAPANYWIHTNMLLFNGKKMSKSDGNYITPHELFTGSSAHVSKGYSPMVLRFFMLQAHYRSTLDLNDEALQAAEKGYLRLMESYRALQNLKPAADAQPLEDEERQINSLLDRAFADMDDDFGTPQALSRLFVLCNKVNALANGQLAPGSIGAATLARMQEVFQDFIFDIFGLRDESQSASGNGNDLAEGLMQLILDLRQQARGEKNWGMADRIREALQSLDVVVKDGKDGSSWTRGR